MLRGRSVDRGCRGRGQEGIVRMIGVILHTIILR